ncbi:MAG: 50S ribosomal protein L11 methyltransferase [Clostridia bacterium]|nr:50S ribosomal protein L11 methyltransferase [Clostridia bacterium]
MRMRWIEVTVHTATLGQDVVSELLMNAGAAGTEIVDRADVPDPALAGANWELVDEALLAAMPEDVRVKGWFPAGAPGEDILARLRERLDCLRAEACFPLGELSLAVRDVADADWAETWKRYYQPFRIGSRIVVKPTWEIYDTAPGDLLIELDPGMAFGAGTHETTRMCLELMETHLTSGMRVMDVGTGSGILSIGAAGLGAKEVLAIDVDPDAVKVAKENVALNHVQEQVRVVEGNLAEGETFACDLAVTNIVADAVCALAYPLRRHLRPGGVWICSGIIRERERDVLAAGLAAGYRKTERRADGEWVALCFRRGV